MCLFDKVLAILQPKSRHMPSSSALNNLRAEDGFVHASQIRSCGVLRIFTALIVSLLLSPTLFAQTMGRIAGVVKDSSGALIPDSQVVLVNPATGVKQDATTGSDGVFTFAAVPVGSYQLDVTAEGFNPYRQTASFKIDVNTALTIDVVLKVSDTSQTVNVTDNTAEVHTSDTQIG